MPVHFHTIDVDGVSIFYREAGPATAPTLLLLHGFPTSSHMFRDLIPLLAGRYHVVAPDYPGFGYSGTPDPASFTYTFDHLAEVMDHFTGAIGLRDYALYLQDFGGPVGLRLAAAHPERVRALIIQNANAYDEGLSPAVRDIVLPAYTDHSPEVVAKLQTFFELPVTKAQYFTGEPAPSLVSPDAWAHAQWGMDRPGNKAIQLALHTNYASNVARYDEWHAYFRAHQPPTLIVWGKGDQVFLPPGAEAYKRDLPNAELQFLDAGHFALETHAAVIATAMLTFLARSSK